MSSIKKLFQFCLLGISVLALCTDTSYAAHAFNQHFDQCVQNARSNWTWSPRYGTSAREGGWLMCLIYYCDTNHGRNVDGCQWYGDLVGKDPQGVKREFAKNFQSLKNFIAIQSLESMRDRIIKRVTQTPNVHQTIFAGYKSRGLKPIVANNMAQRNWQLYVWDMFNPRSYDDKRYVYNHQRKYCSYIDIGKLCKPTSEYPNGRMSLPHDMLASTLLGSTEIPSSTSEYIYTWTHPGGKDYYFVDSSDQEAFLKRYGAVVDEKVITYPDVNRQEAAITYIRNLTSGVPMTVLPDKQLFVNKSQHIFESKIGEPYMKSRLDLMTSLTLARSSFLRMFSERLPNDRFKAFPKPDPNTEGATGLIDEKTRKTSLLGLLEHESKRRMQDGDWYSKMSKLPEEAIVRELASILALQMKINFRVLKHYEKMEALLGGNLSYGINAYIKETTQAQNDATQNQPS